MSEPILCFRPMSQACESPGRNLASLDGPIFHVRGFDYNFRVRGSDLLYPLAADNASRASFRLWKRSDALRDRSGYCLVHTNRCCINARRWRFSCQSCLVYSDIPLSVRFLVCSRSRLIPSKPADAVASLFSTTLLDITCTKLMKI